MIKILPLSSKYLAEAGILVDNIFPNNEVLPSVGLAASVYDEVRIKINLDYSGNFNWFKYWIATDESSRKIVGIVGLYEQEPDEIDSCWLGWYGVHSDFRNKGIGAKLLTHAIQEAKILDKKFLRVYTSNNSSRTKAQAIYKSFGFKPMKELPNNAEDDQLYFELELQP